MKTDRNGSEIRDGMLTIRLSKGDSGYTLAVVGELDLANAGTLAEKLAQVESEGTASVRIDLSELEFIDSTGIALLVATHRNLAGSERLSVVPSRANAVRRVMAVTGLDAQLPFAANSAAAC